MATISANYASPVSVTFGVNSLASNSGLIVGYETSEIDNTSNKYDDFIIRGKVTTGTSPTASTNIEIWVVPVIGASTYPDVFDGTASAETVTSRNVLRSFARLAHVIVVDSNSDREYGFHFLMSEIPGIGQVMPTKFVLFVVHNTGVNLNATGSNHTCEYVGVKWDVA